jgi:hypothetical protein
VSNGRAVVLDTLNLLAALGGLQTAKNNLLEFRTLLGEKAHLDSEIQQVNAFTTTAARAALRAKVLLFGVKMDDWATAALASSGHVDMATGHAELAKVAQRIRAEYDESVKALGRLVIWADQALVVLGNP